MKQIVHADTFKSTEMDKKERDREESGMNWMGQELGLYLHVPFCSTICDFCAFYQETADRQRILDYLDGVEKELALAKETGPVSTVFWGGGTPGLLPAKDLDRLCVLLKKKYGAPLDEWTVEMAPSSIKADKLQVLKDHGVTRISMGIQSLNETFLEALGRQHSRKQALKAYDLTRDFDFDSVNLDLIFAIPGQSESEWRFDLGKTLALEPDHLSTYCLTFEEDTALYVKLSQGKVKIDVEREVAIYEATWEEMAAKGYAQYEISNYARPGKQCLHNLNTWRMQQWDGLGPSASSQFGGRRYSNPADLKLWREDLAKGIRGTADVTTLSKGLLFEDCLIFGLRMNEGVDLAALESRFEMRLPGEVNRIIEELESHGKLVASGRQIVLTPEGRMIADAVGQELLGSFAVED